MRGVLCVGLLAAIAATAGAADGEPRPGAKEIFFSSTSNVVAGAPRQRLGVPAPPPAQPQAISAVQGGQPPSHAPAGTSKQRRPTAAAALQPVALRYWVELLQSDPRGPGQPVAPDRRFRSGERVRLHFESNVAGQIALFQLGSNGAAGRLYPDPSDSHPGYVLPARQSRGVPEGNSWFRFDEQPGVEHLLVVFSSRADELTQLKVASRMAPAATRELLQGTKNLVLETEREDLSQVGTFVANESGGLIVLPIDLQHD